MVANVRGKEAPVFVPLSHGSLNICRHHVLEKVWQTKVGRMKMSQEVSCTVPKMFSRGHILKSKSKCTLGKSLDPVDINIICGFPTNDFIINGSWMLIKNYSWEHLLP